MSRKVIMTTNERRLQLLNQMRASYRGVQLLKHIHLNSETLAKAKSKKPEFILSSGFF